MKNITIKDLKPHLQIIKTYPSFYECRLTFLVPLADNPNLLIPVKFAYSYRKGMNKKIFIQHCMYSVGSQLLKIHHLFNVEQRYEVINPGNGFQEYTFYHMDDIRRPAVQTPYETSQIIKRETFKKIVCQFLVR